MAGLAITGYKYALSTSTDNVTYQAYPGSYTTSSWTSGTTFTISGLTNGTYYKVKIRAVNSLGEGAESAEIGPFKPFKVATATTTTGSDSTASASAPTTNAPTSTQSYAGSNNSGFIDFGELGSGTWTNPAPLGATTGTGTLNGSAGTTHFVWGTSSGSYPNEVAATSNAYVRTTWPRGTTVYYKAKTYATSCAATFNGTVNSNGDSTTVTFEYGTSSGVYPSSVSAGTVTALTATAVTATVSGLAAGTYYYRTKAVNAAGTTYGTQQTIAVAITSSLATSERSFTPPYVGTLYNLLVVGGGGGTGQGGGGGGGGVSYRTSATAPSSLAFYVGSFAGNGIDAGTGSSLVGGSINMTATGGGVAYWTGSYTVAGSGGVGSGGTFNSPGYAGGGDGAYGDSDYATGGGGGATSLGGGVFNPGNPYSASAGNGGQPYSFSSSNNGSFYVGAGGGGYDSYWDDGRQDGVTPTSSYGAGKAQRYPNSGVAQGGIVCFEYPGFV